MSFVGKAIGGITGANSQAKAAQNAASTQADSAKYASDIQKQMFDQTRKDQQQYMDAGGAALKKLLGLSGLNNEDTRNVLYSDPGYQFRLNQGLDATQSSAAAGGGLLSGATLKALNNYAQDTASNEYGNAYNRLSNLVGLGQNAAAGVGNAGLQTGQAMANNAMAGANTTAAGQIAAGNRNANNFQQMLGLGGLAAGLFI
ncbi:DNA transfer protein p32 [Acinetobacter sp. Ac_5812]|uniref:DNA transfer protein p32 n=1 Tax=Acinetobacter sp. Ac_5812 TaxID=1848937 RepID=UPI0014901E9E|nr:DNA transfer protein p32 [Acinetobacter sp. Ac_5812]NNP70928.1 DNA transfer protein p32 [Acinetobacter sp. Ac_5812]